MERKQSVWVVDDEPNGFEVIELLLRREGYNLTYFNSGKEVLSQLASSLPDVILLDVMMPEIDGIETCRRIKANSNWKPIPIIIVTALDSKEDLARSLAAGADDFLTKPINGVELRARVRSMLRIKQQYDALQASVNLRRDLSKLVVEDIRQPMSTVLLGSHLLLQSNLEAKDRERAEMVHTAGLEIDAIINGLLRLAKMESGKLVLNPVEVDLNELAEVVVENFQAIVNSKQIQLITKLPQQGRWLNIDAELFHRLLNNLITNAIQSSPPTSTITLQIDYPDDSLQKLIIRVTDEGTGINRELQQSIFTQYELGNLTNGNSQIGLSLAFCKMVAEAHGGTITIEDNQPNGAVVIVEI
ncbi:hybrid sensor histidine kinase/response regulator [Nostoc sp. FACHB-152]|uniref:hybrid sensor histidine kinase/response regulator n=1 Tax=unclassified Nostoc TaxID=2593658 RepID=UPI0016891195|nr:MULTISPECIES: hybrid sensor histidine kinase/response regulator [unclassified Nostoc]MBD2452035.1 hybrid sensor histidine kinase/response regulator [Nostoc sp. FACHB-152]MBD2469858.1 hybrid sensor histidine kinase/response regulator [Nostoc sp. FACHB-145]